MIPFVHQRININITNLHYWNLLISKLPSELIYVINDFQNNQLNLLLE